MKVTNEELHDVNGIRDKRRTIPKT